MSRPLDKLVLKDAEVEEELLAGTLESLVSITEDGSLIPREGFDSLAPDEKILAMLLALKALKLLDKRQDDVAGPKELADLSGVPEGTVKRTVRELQKEERLLKSDKGKYSIPPYSYQSVIQRLRKGE